MTEPEEREHSEHAVAHVAAATADEAHDDAAAARETAELALDVASSAAEHVNNATEEAAHTVAEPVEHVHPDVIETVGRHDGILSEHAARLAALEAHEHEHEGHVAVAEEAPDEVTVVDTGEPKPEEEPERESEREPERPERREPERPKHHGPRRGRR